MAARERKAVGVRDFCEWEEWAKPGGGVGVGGGGGGGVGVGGSGRGGIGEGDHTQGSDGGGDPLAAHRHPVPLL